MQDSSLGYTNALKSRRLVQNPDDFLLHKPFHDHRSSKDGPVHHPINSGGGDPKFVIGTVEFSV